VGVLGGDILRNFSLAFSLPRDAAQSASMSFYNHLPAGDLTLAADGYSVIKFSLRGATDVTTASRSGRPSLPSSRVVIRTCGAPAAFAPDKPQQTCKTGQLELAASGKNLLLALSTGHGPLVLSQSAWQRLGNSVPAPLGTGEPLLYSPLVADPIPAHWGTLSRLALVDSDSGDIWPGACAELARARRIEWVLANQDQPGACFEACDISGSTALPAAAYLELGPDLPAAVVSDTSDLISNLNQDFPLGAQVDGLIGAETLAGVRFELDYVSQPQGRLVASCEPGTDRQSCWSAPRCLGLSKGDQPHTCFGLQERRFSPACPP
jgi:hypothetical protein